MMIDLTSRCRSSYTFPTIMSQPTEDEVYDLLSACRFGETEEVQQFIEKHGKEAVAAARDESGNTVLHMCCANGHVGEPNASKGLLSRTNASL